MLNHGHDLEDELERKHYQAKEDEEQEGTFSIIAKAIATARSWRHIARLEHEHAHVYNDEGQLAQCCQHLVLTSLERSHREAHSKEYDTNEERQQDTGVLRLARDEQNVAS